MIHRYQALTETRGVTDGLETDWAGFAGRALERGDADQPPVAPRQADRRRRRPGLRRALPAGADLLDESDATIEQARGLRDELAGYHRRLDADDAGSTATPPTTRRVRQLYDALLESKGRVTDRVREAFAGEQAARSGPAGRHARRSS